MGWPEKLIAKASARGHQVRRRPAMITRIHIQNYRSFVDAEVKLRPFSLVIGANGSGKTNFLTAISMLLPEPGQAPRWASHVNVKAAIGSISVELNDGSKGQALKKPDEGKLTSLSGWCASRRAWISVFRLVPDVISEPEEIEPFASVEATGAGTAQVLESLKSGDREDLFDAIESNFKKLIPEVEKLSLRTINKGKKQIQVRECSLNEPLSANELSEGTRLVLATLTIIHQEEPPPVILLEDIDRGMHPRIFEQVVPLMRDIAEKHDINIIATTHNPYLVDCFQDDKEAVIIVEKKDGASTLSTLASRLEGLDYDKIDPDDMPLGNLWYSGFVGGVPGRASKRVER